SAWCRGAGRLAGSLFGRGIRPQPDESEAAGEGDRGRDRSGATPDLAMTKSRLEAFSDGVFAIAITLLVLQIDIPGPGGNLAHEVGHLWPSFAAYLVSFFTIGIIWVNHHGIMRRIEKVDRTLLFLNLNLLL